MVFLVLLSSLIFTFGVAEQAHAFLLFMNAALSIPSFVCVDMEWVERSKYKVFEMEMSVALTELFNHF